MASLPFAGLRDVTLHKFCFYNSKALSFTRVCVSCCPQKGETHLNYLHRVSVLYEFATEFSDEEWKKSHVHAQKIYNKIDDSLPTSARSKFRELMMEDRKNSSMTAKAL